MVGSKETIIPQSVEEIGDFAFGYCMGLIEIVIPDNTKRIGARAFLGCQNLRKINIHDNLEYIGKDAFHGCTSLPVEDNARYIDKILLEVVDKSVTECKIRVDTCFIFGQAFSNCTQLISIDIPDSVVGIGAGAFENCTGLKSVRLPNGIRTIGDDTFYGCSALESIFIPDNVTVIGYHAFENCTALRAVHFSDNLKRIEGYAFRRCHSLISVELPTQLNEIFYSAFQECTSLKSIHIYAKAPVIADENIEEYDMIFDDCSFENGQKFTDSDAFDGIDFNKVALYIPSEFREAYQNYPAFRKFKTIRTEEILAARSLFTYSNDGKTICGVRNILLTSITIPEMVEKIEDFAFAGCSELESITIPDRISAIGKGILDGCKKLSAIKVDSDNPYYDSRDDCNAIIETTSNTLVAGCKNTIMPNNVEAIASYAFKSSALEKITIPASITSIGKDAFIDCSKLQEIHILITLPNKLSVRANEFKGVDLESCFLFIPKGCLEVYRSHPAFCRFKNIQADGNFQTSEDLFSSTD